jgi:hypothetical protein
MTDNIGRRIKVLTGTNFWDPGQRFRVVNEDEFYLYFDNSDGKYCAIEKKLEGTDFEFIAFSSDQEYYRENRNEVLEQKRAYRQDLKNLVVRTLGGRCANCGYDKPAALDVKGGTPRGKLGYTAYYNSVLSIIQMYPSHPYFLMCANCQRLDEKDEKV